MAACEICNKTVISARRESKRGSYVTKRALRTQKPNVRNIRVVINGGVKSISVCARCLRSKKVTRAV